MQELKLSPVFRGEPDFGPHRHCPRCYRLVPAKHHDQHVASCRDAPTNQPLNQE